MVKKRSKAKPHAPAALSPEDEKQLFLLRERLQKGPDNLDQAERKEIFDLLRSSPPLMMALVETVAARPSEEAARLLIRLQSLIGDKKLLKAVKQALYRMKQQGVQFDDAELKSEERPVFQWVEKNEPYGMITSIDGFGDRIAFLIMPERPRGWRVGGGIIGDEHPLREVFFAAMNRSDVNTFLKDWQSNVNMQMVRTEARHCCSVFLECFERMEARGEKLDQTGLDLKSWIMQHCERLERPAIYEFMNEKNISNRPDLAARSKLLFTIYPFATWLLPEETMIPYLEEIRSASHSKIVLSQGQQAQRMDDIRRKAADQIFTPEKRAVMIRRLEESAYVLFKQDQAREAELALAAAIDLKKEPSPLRESEFLLTMVELSLRYWTGETEEEEKEEDSSGLIIP